VREVPGTQKIYVKTFGCSHNISDSEFMMGQLVEYGYKLVESLQECDLTILNSCTVKNPSQEAFIT
jgi:threonylcarbamoyladenosine tRNA methylthiotransferase CDKAL1